MERRDLYEVLGVARGAPSEEIKSAYRRLAREHHPDLNPDDAKAEERFKQLAVAKDVLLDEEKRRAYDEFGFEGLESGFDPEQGRAYREWAERAERTRGAGGFSSAPNMDDLLSQLFGEGAQYASAPRPPRRGADAETELTIDFLTSVTGGDEPLRLQGRPELRVTIPPGAHEGTRLRLAGKGMQPAPGVAPGDLFVRLRVRPHPFYTRDGNDLHLDLPVTIPELILGAELSVPTPAGPVTMKVPARSTNGQRMRLKGKGIAAHGARPNKNKKQGGKAGDLFVRLVAVLPELKGDSKGEELDALARDLASYYGDVDVRAALGSYAS